MTRVDRRPPASMLLLMLLCVVFMDVCRSEGIAVIGPKYLQPSKLYTVVFSNFMSQNVRLEVTLRNKPGSNATFHHQQNILVSRAILKSISFPVENISADDYTLSIRSSDPNFSFDEDIELIYNSKTMSVFIQTDKPVYKPDDKLQFRVIVLDSDTRPVSNLKTIAVSLIDTEGSSIRKWPYAQLHNGVFQSTVQLASSPVLGNWTITVATPESTVNKTILVKEYVLPTFYVKARASEILLIARKKISILIESSYTFGGYVDGIAKVELYLEEDGFQPDFKTTTRITGVTMVEFDLKEELYYNVDAGDHTNVFVNVEVTETFSNRTMKITESIPVYNYPYKISVIESNPRFWPGLKYPMKLSVKDHHGVPARSGTTIHIKYRYEGNGYNYDDTIQRTISQDGSVSLTLEPPSIADTIQIDVDFESVKYDSIANIPGAQSLSQQYIRIMLNPKYKLRVGKDAQFDVSCTEPMKHISYVVISRGSVVDSNYVKIANRPRYPLKLKMTTRMAPRARIIVFYIKDKFLLFDDLVLNFELFANEFKLSLDKQEFIPGEDISVHIRTAPGSFVALSAIDQSALLLGRDGNDFTNEDVLKDLSLYESVDPNIFDPFHHMGLFLKTTAKIDVPRDRLLRFGDLMSAHEKYVKKAIHIRKEFHETWLWTNLTMRTKDRDFTYKHTVPDTITSWYVSGFAIHPELGVGILSEPQSLVVNKPFYLIANLPYSIKRGETALIQVTVFNFLGNNLTTDVILYNKNDEIEFIGQPIPDSSSFKKVVITVTNTGKPVSFMIKAKKLGEIAIKIEAVNQLESDAIEHMLRVTPESHLVEKNVARFIDLPTEGRIKFPITLDIPSTVDEGSVKINFTLDANGLSTTIDNLDKLVKMPSGCGEQNMVHFVPNIVILDYLGETGIVDSTAETKIKNYMESGYQNQLKYKRSDGSFSVFQREPSGSTFLTAFVAKSFKIADKYMHIDKSVVTRAFDWLTTTQRPGGQFVEVGKVWHADMQGALRETNFALTAYVAAAFLETRDIFEAHKGVVTSALTYLSKNLDIMNDTYDLSLTTYALSLANHSKKKEFLQKLLSSGTQDIPFWTRSSGSIEVAGYAVLSQISQNLPFDAANTVRWLTTQRYATGSFGGTQDTFVGLKALASYAARTSRHKNNYRVIINHKPARAHVFDVDKQKSLYTQHVEIPNTVRALDITVEGIGTGFFQVAAQYYHNIQVAKQSFVVNVTLLSTTTHFVQNLQVCVAFDPPEKYKRTNMAVVEVFFPSGFIAEKDAVTDLSATREIQKTELRFGGSSVAVYYYSLGVEKQCFEVTAYRRYKVAFHQPAYVVAYDYYKNSINSAEAGMFSDRFGITKYIGKVMQLCDICEDEDCLTLSC